MPRLCVGGGNETKRRSQSATPQQGWVSRQASGAAVGLAQPSAGQMVAQKLSSQKHRAGRGVPASFAYSDLSEAATD
jgi:hypothetical protein